VKKAELRRIGLYLDRLEAAALNETVLTEAESLELCDLLKKWVAEIEEEAITQRVPSSWGDVRKLLITLTKGGDGLSEK